MNLRRRVNSTVGLLVWSTGKEKMEPMNNTLSTARKTLSVSCIALLSLMVASCDCQRQMADPNFDTKVPRPAYVNEHPKVLFDEAHHNVHTTGGLYKPFVDLVSNDGYQV